VGGGGEGGSLISQVCKRNGVDATRCTVHAIRVRCPSVSAAEGQKVRMGGLLLQNVSESSKNVTLAEASARRLDMTLKRHSAHSPSSCTRRTFWVKVLIMCK